MKIQKSKLCKIIASKNVLTKAEINLIVKDFTAKLGQKLEITADKYSVTAEMSEHTTYNTRIIITCSTQMVALKELNSDFNDIKKAYKDVQSSFWIAAEGVEKLKIEFTVDTAANFPTIADRIRKTQ